MEKLPKLHRHLSVLLVCLVLLTGCQSQGTTPTSVATTQPTAAEPTAVSATPTAVSTSAAASVTSEVSSVISAKITLDPALTQDADSLKVCQYLYDGLVRLDANGQPEGALASAWTVSGDQLDYIFTLRSNISFSDGTAITPDIIVDNFNRWFDPESTLHGTNDYVAWVTAFEGYHGEKDANNRAKSSVDGIQKLDQNKVLIHLNRPVKDILTILAKPEFAILNTTSLAAGNYGGRESTIVSSGAYVVSAWTDTSLTLSPNPKYWGTAAAGDMNFTLQ